MYAGTSTPMCYRNHFESVYCISSTGEVEDCATGKRYRVEPGTIYILDKHDEHVLHAETELTVACVFNPALHGREVHDESGAYPLEAEAVEARLCLQFLDGRTTILTYLAFTTPRTSPIASIPSCTRRRARRARSRASRCGSTTATAFSSSMACSVRQRSTRSLPSSIGCARRLSGSIATR